jgi:hypothetical protein
MKNADTGTDKNYTDTGTDKKDEKKWKKKIQERKKDLINFRMRYLFKSFFFAQNMGPDWVQGR